jgi:hypothetical protein
VESPRHYLWFDQQSWLPDVAQCGCLRRLTSKARNATLSLRASGAISPSEAVAYVQGLGIRSIVFGASSRQHIKETMELIQGGTQA